MTTERNIYRIVLAVAVGYILFLQMCNNVNPCPEQIKTVTVDTGFIIEQFKSTWQKPKPDVIILPGKTPKPKFIYLDSPPIVIGKPVDTAAILKDYFAKVYYRDSLQTKYGTVTIEDTISQNRIQARRWSTNFSIPIITKIITDSIKPRNQLYVGFNGLFGQQSIGGEINLSLKNKRDQQFEVGAGLYNAQLYYKIGTKFKLSLK